MKVALKVAGIGCGGFASLIVLIAVLVAIVQPSSNPTTTTAALAGGARPAAYRTTQVRSLLSQTRAARTALTASRRLYAYPGYLAGDE